MNIAKIQQEILKQLLTDPSGVKYFDAPEDRIFVTIDQKVGYLLPREQLRLDLSCTQLALSLWDLIEDSTERMHNLLMETDEYRLGGKARKYLRTDEHLLPDDEKVEIYVDQGLLKNFDHPQLWQLPGDPKNAIAVTETFCSDGKPVPVGIVCPVQVNN